MRTCLSRRKPTCLSRRKATIFVRMMIGASLAVLLFGTCGKPPSRQYFMLNYMPPQMAQRSIQEPYGYVIRLRDFSIEEAYNRSHIVYRLNPFELRYYNYKSWAVRPTRMVTDLFFKHLNSVRLVSSVVRRLDEAGRRPDFEISGFIEALEEYDSDDMLFAHIALRINMTRLSDGSTVYSRHFDLRKRVYNRGTEFVVKELSQIIEYIFSEVITDIDQKLAAEYGVVDIEIEAPPIIPVKEPSFTSDFNDGD